MILVDDTNKPVVDPSVAVDPNAPVKPVEEGQAPAGAPVDPTAPTGEVNPDGEEKKEEGDTAPTAPTA